MSRRRRLKQNEIEAYLQGLNGFDKPKVHLEQYATQPHVASMILYTINNCYDDINGKLIADLGCGSGNLTMASLLADARLVYGFDIDDDALNICLRNAHNLFNDDERDSNDDNDVELKSTYRHCPNLNLVRADLVNNEKFWVQFNNRFDVCLTNPPFGTKHNKGMDILFLKRAINLATDSVYSLHKSSTRDYIRDKCKQWQVTSEPIFQIKYDIPNTYKFHHKNSVDIEVDLWRITSLPRDPIR